MTKDEDFFMARANAILSRSYADPEQRAQADAKAAAYEAHAAQREQERKAQYRQQKDEQQAFWREARRRRLQESRNRALRDGQVEIIPDPGKPPTLAWFNDFLLHRVPGLYYSQCRNIGHIALGMGAERLPAGHPNPPAYVLNFAKRVMKGDIADFVPEASTIGREHLLRMGSQNPRFTATDPEAGELPPHLREVAAPVMPQMPRESQLRPLSDAMQTFVTRVPKPSAYGRQPGED